MCKIDKINVYHSSVFKYFKNDSRLATFFSSLGFLLVADETIF